MAATIIRALGFTNTLQQLVWAGNNGTPVTAYIWGGGGGGGGNDGSAQGGNGSGGGFSRVTFAINAGDVLQVGVGGKGLAGSSSSGTAPGGGGGASTTGYYGGTGGSAGPTGSSGGGGGGGGATVVTLNGTPIAVAGGGGGGGGAGNVGARNGDNAPGGQGQSGSLTNGGAGEIKTGDGGGGGAGGGGRYGGLGGSVRSGDQGAYAGAVGGNLGDSTATPSGRNPGGTSNAYYVNGVGLGGTTAGNGTAGYAVFEFTISGAYVNYDGTFQAIDKTYVKHQGAWQPVEATWIKVGGVWEPIVGSYAPEFVKISGGFGTPGKVCVSVIDECSRSASTMQNNWNSFLSRRAGTPFYLLQPGVGGASILKVPGNYNSAGGVGPITVNRDNGSTAARSDWFTLCGLSAYPSGTIVQLSIDNSGSMTFSTVAASYSYFLTQCAAAGMTVQLLSMPNEDWIAPFIYA